MPPKGAKGGGKEHEEAPDVTESRRLTERAFDVGVLSRTRRMCSNALPPTKLMTRACGKDIVKKPSTRKGRYLLAFNFQLAPAAAGRLGTLAALDTKNPVMYLDFPQGRYKLFGTLVFPKNKYVVLRLGQREVLCEDVLESLIVFSEGWWVGSTEDNPEERRLPEPDWLAQPALHAKYDFSGRSQAAAAACQPGRGWQAAYVSDERWPRRDLAGDDSEEGEPPAAATASKAKQGTLDLFLKKKAGAGSSTAAAGGGKQQGQVAASAGKGKAAAATKPGAPAAKGGSAKKQRKRAASESEEEDMIDLIEDSSDEGGAADEDAPPSSARPRSQRKAAGAAAKKLRIEEDDEEEEEDGGGEADLASDDDASAGQQGSEERQQGSEEEDDDEEEEASEEGGSDYEPSE